MPRIIHNWREVLTRGYATWCIYVVIVLQTIDFFGMVIAQYFPLWLSIPVLLAAVAVRLIKQPAVSGD